MTNLFVVLKSYSVLDKDPRGSKVLVRYAIVSILEIKAEKEHLIMKLKKTALLVPDGDAKKFFWVTRGP